MASAFLYLIDYPESDGSELFGFLDKSNTYPCKWYQVGCHLQQLNTWIKEHKELIDTILRLVAIIVSKL